MSYGLYDGDLKLYPQVPFFNLELMKLSSYYKQKREIVSLTTNYTPSLYTNYIVRQDYPSKQPYSSFYTNVEYGGRAFSNTNYQPLDLAIERMRPDVHLYDKLEPKEYKTDFNTMRRAEHLRLSLDGKTIWKDYSSQLRRESTVYGIIFHDYNLNDIEGGYELAVELVNNEVQNPLGRRIGMKFPVQVENEHDFLKWMNIKPMGKYYSLQFNGVPDQSYAEEILEVTKHTSIKKQTYLNPTQNYTYEEFITTGVLETYKSILDLRRHDLVFPLIYDKGFFKDYRWEEVFNLIQKFIMTDFHSCSLQERLRKYKFYSMYSYVTARKVESRSFYQPYNVDRARRIFQFVRENNYELFKLFYEYTGELK